MQRARVSCRARPEHSRGTAVASRGTLRFLAGSCAIHVALLGVAWGVWTEGERREPPTVVAASMTTVAELAPPPETPPEVVPDVERPRDEESVEGDAPPLDATWEPDFDTAIAVADARSESFLRAPRGPIRARGAAGGVGDGAGTTRAAVPPAAAPAPSPEPPMAQIEAPARAQPRLARVLEIRRPSYPERARESGTQGAVSLEVDVLTDGSVGDVRVVQSSGSRLLDDAAVDAVRAWRFEPATDGVTAIASTVMLPPIRFRIDG